MDVTVEFSEDDVRRILVEHVRDTMNVQGATVTVVIKLPEGNRRFFVDGGQIKQDPPQLAAVPEMPNPIEVLASLPQSEPVSTISINGRILDIFSRLRITTVSAKQVMTELPDVAKYSIYAALSELNNRGSIKREAHGVYSVVTPPEAKAV